MNKPIELNRNKSYKGVLLAVSSLFLGALGIVLLLFLNAINAIQPSILIQIKWPVILLTTIVSGICVCLLIYSGKTFGRRVLLVLVAVILLLGFIFFEITVFFAQDKILFMQPKGAEQHNVYVNDTFQNVENISIETEDQNILIGWMIHNSSEQGKSPLILYLGGNNESVPPNFLQKLSGWNIAFINYRGYGFSEGVPNETNLKADGLILFDYLSQRKDVDLENIVIIGRSLGSGVATYIADNRIVSGVVFISPYDSMVNVTTDLFPLFPSQLVNNDFNSFGLADSITTPVLSIIGDKDFTIRPQRSNKLLSKWAGEKQIVIIQGANHNSIMSYDILAEAVSGFLSSIRKSI